MKTDVSHYGIIYAKADSVVLHAGECLVTEIRQVLMEHGNQFFIQGTHVVRVICSLIVKVQLDAEDAEKSGFEINAILFCHMIQRDGGILYFPYDSF